MKISRPLSLTVVGALAAGLLPLVVAAPAQAAPVNPIPVTAADISADGSSGWALESRNTGNGAFVSGTSTPPLGTGSYRLKSNAIGDKKYLHMTKVDGVPLVGRPLTDLTALSYSSYAANVSTRHTSISRSTAASSTPTTTVLPTAPKSAFPAQHGQRDPRLRARGRGQHLGDQHDDRASAPRGGSPVRRHAAATIPTWTYKTWSGVDVDPHRRHLQLESIGDIQWVIGDTSTPPGPESRGWVDAIDVTTTTESATYDLEEGLWHHAPSPSDGLPTKTLTLTEPTAPPRLTR